MAADHQQATDELMLRDLPGKLAILVFALATLALGWELGGTVFQSGWPFFGVLPALDTSHIIGVSTFTAGWFALLTGLLVIRHRRHASGI